MKKNVSASNGLRARGSRKQSGDSSHRTRPQGRSSSKNASGPKVMEWELRLYVAGNTPNSIAALSNLQHICEEHMGGRYRIEIIDLFQSPQLASGDQIVAVPTLVRRLPTPIKKIIGDLSNAERVLVGLDLKPARSYAARR